VPAVFQLSTQSERSLPDARLALDEVKSLQPIDAELASAGVAISDRRWGHVWAFSPSTRLLSEGTGPVAGDIGLRIEPGMVTLRYYEVLTFLPNQGHLAALVNGEAWKMRDTSYPHFVAFKPFTRFRQRKFLELVNEVRHADYVTGPRYEARFLPVRSADLLALLKGS